MNDSDKDICMRVIGLLSGIPGIHCISVIQHENYGYCVYGYFQTDSEFVKYFFLIASDFDIQLNIEFQKECYEIRDINNLKDDFSFRSIEPVVPKIQELVPFFKNISSQEDTIEIYTDYPRYKNIGQLKSQFKS